VWRAYVLTDEIDLSIVEAVGYSGIGPPKSKATASAVCRRTPVAIDALVLSEL
jgi:hypothetical protein